MQLFVDTADTDQIAELAATGLVDGVTTNPSLVARTGRDFRDVITEITQLVPGPVSAEVTETSCEGMVTQGRELAGIASNVVVKVPLTWEGLQACHVLTGQDDPIDVNVTLCFSATQALLAAKAGARFVSPFIGRLDDIGQNGMALIRDVVDIYRSYPRTLKTEVLVASVRGPGHVLEAAKLGADAATVPPGVLRQLVAHPLTDKGLAAFLADWEKARASAGSRG
ncbi:MAG: fructose-6-phosphate aldolase [Rhodospirillales bacterium]|nr:fructose-6-phosphate aldolase [Rhodospirillales bacterium]